MSDYNFSEIERKWQDIWEKEGAFKAGTDFTKPKFYGLIEFPYPSGNGLHVGHPKSNTAIDIISRKRRMEGYNVLYPIGWDAFGLPTENYAIKNKIHPAIVTKQNINRFRSQLKKIGFSFDWDREVDTTDPSYYKWTQWIFIQLYKHGLAYKAEVPINWCTSCKVGLANEEVVNGVCERCGGEVVQKVKSQWMLKITEYAERLYDDLDQTDFIDRVKTQQRNWIGKSKGAEVDFQLTGTDEKVTVFTTRPDTLFGATYMVLSPEHKILERLSIENKDEVEDYKKEAAKKSEFERTEMNKDKTGVMLKGVMAVNPVNGREIPIWISDYVLATYGTGAIMAVPAHDDRDWAFAKKFGMPIIEVVGGGKDVNEEAFTDIYDGTMVNSDFLNGMKVKDAIDAMIKYLEEKGIGHAKTNFKLRDWVFSRQRYWGEPIPMVYCEHCGWQPLPEESLPLELPYAESYEPTDNGESPLSKLTDWVNTTCPKCGGPGKRETDTMPNWAGSSWYFIRYVDPHNDKFLADPELLKYWMPVDWYNGGMEHTTLHLLYSRFWHKFLYDIGVVPTSEPYQKRTSHGMILGANGEKMSKSRGNVVNPDDIISEFGADTLRMYEMFMGAFDQEAPWSTESIRGCFKFLDRVYRLLDIVEENEGYSIELETLIHKTIKKVSDDYEKMKFNTAIATMMSFVNEVIKVGKITKGELKTFITLLNPVAPHLTEEMWEKLGLPGRLYQTTWPCYDEAKTVDREIEIPIQVNGKVRSTIRINKDAESSLVEKLAFENEDVLKFINGHEIVKKIYVPGRIYTIVIR
ncbi:MAG: leucine--tRNA ligase [Clostridia bacterium]|nr:leucine--tRNA ligase [Clostridia bacterium]